MGDDNWIDGIYTATNNNFEALLCETTKDKIWHDKWSMSLAWDLGQLGTKSWVINDEFSVEKPKWESILTKIDINKDVDQETQLVNIENKHTLQGRVNLLKVRDIWWALRRRYATRKNPQKIFQTWDEKKKGVIDSDDIVRMINKLGININHDEAMVLLYSAD